MREVRAVETLGPPPGDALIQAQIGLSTKDMRQRITSNNPELDTIGLAIAQPLVLPLPSAVTMLTMTRPTTSSIMAAPIRTTPTRVFCRPADDIIANVVPRDVEHSEAPAENAAKGLGYAVPALVGNGRTRRINDNAIGINNPTVAIDIDIYALLRSNVRSVLRPPSKTRLIKPRYPNAWIASWVSCLNHAVPPTGRPQTTPIRISPMIPQCNRWSSVYLTPLSNRRNEARERITVIPGAS